MDSSDKNDAGTRVVLLAAAREMIAEDTKFSLKTLLTKSGISRARFRRCFANKEELLTALTGEEIKGLDEILEAAQPSVQTLRAAVGSDFVPEPVSARASSAPVAPAVADAWLERRLRVFERALAGLEKRQDKSEQAWMLQMGLVGERLNILEQRPVIAAPAPEAKAAAPEPKAAAPVHFEATEREQAEPKPLEMKAAAAQAIPAEIQELTPAGQAFAEEIAAVLEPIGEKEIADFMTHARKVAQNAAIAEPPSPKRLMNMKWLAWGGAVLATLLLCAGIILASGALGGPAGAQPVMVNSGVTHRHVAQNGVARLVALADSGNAAAQTELALDYIKGSGVAGDDQAARRWSLAAASQGQPVAEYLLGTLYLEGTRDESEAARWFLAAAAQGNVKAMHNLAIAYAQGSGVEKDPAEAVKWFVRAAGQGYRDSEFDLAVLYERGLGVPQSARAALKWYLIAAARGDAPSAARAAFLKGQMDPMEVRLAMTEAASFVPQPAGDPANATPAL